MNDHPEYLKGLWQQIVSEMNHIRTLKIYGEIVAANICIEKKKKVIPRLAYFTIFNYVRAAQIEEEMNAANHQEAKIASKQNGSIQERTCNVNQIFLFQWNEFVSMKYICVKPIWFACVKEYYENHQ